ncbi:MAG: hypothetical protein WBF90_12595 [Rivularia sp. (in: cyanobacteria)]
MKRKNGKIIMTEEEFAVNFFFGGVAVQYLEKYSDKSKEWWMEYLSEIAGKQYSDMKKKHPKQLEQMIEVYAAAGD